MSANASDDERDTPGPERESREKPTGSPPSRGSDEDAVTGGSEMRARTWVLAYHYGDPSDYGIPELPPWTVVRTDRGGLALAEGGDEPFVRAERPVPVRR